LPTEGKRTGCDPLERTAHYSKVKQQGRVSPNLNLDMAEIPCRRRRGGAVRRASVVPYLNPRRVEELLAVQ
jgi:hypothetical protein